MYGILPEERGRQWARRQVTGSTARKLILLLIVDDYGPGKRHQVADLAAAAEISVTDVLNALADLQTAGLISFATEPGNTAVRISSILAG